MTSHPKKHGIQAVPTPSTELANARQISRSELDRQITACQKCPRLIEHCQHVAATKRRAYRDQTYWGGPVPNLWRPGRGGQSDLLIVGLAPAAHGANRTGRMFTGDRSGDWLFRGLHKAGFATQPTAISRSDNLRLVNCSITAVCHCAPPQNKPQPSEIHNCRGFLQATFLLTRPRVVLCLGKLAWTETLRWAQEQNWFNEKLTPAQRTFRHAVSLPTSQEPVLLASYHPSQQNTFTGKLTESMFDQVLQKARQLIG